MTETVEVNAVPGLAVLTGGVRAVPRLQVLTGPVSPELDWTWTAQRLISAPGRVVVVRVGQLGGERRRRVVREVLEGMVGLEGVRHVVRRPSNTLTLRVCTGGGTGLSRRVLLLLLLVVMVVMMVMLVMLVMMMMVSWLETAVVGGIMEGPGAPQLGWDVEVSQVE